MRKLILLGGLAFLATPAFAQFDGGVNGLGDARQINMPTSQVWGGQPQVAPEPVAAEEEEVPAPAAPVKTKKKTARH